MATEHDQIEVRSRVELRDWLAANHTRSESIWLVTWKKPSPHHLPYDAVVEEVLCFGWIDSQPRLLDTERSMIRLSPRKPKSGWSKVNKVRIEKLISTGLMTPAGLTRVEEAKRSGAWELLDAAHARVVPDDLLSAFHRHPKAEQNFNAFPPSAQKAILEWISLAKRDETRAIRVEETARLAAENRRANQWKKP
jgi:uncharacterized protein YdeI (YjbR/CyaY-like superfamily)